MLISCVTSIKIKGHSKLIYRVCYRPQRSCGQGNIFTGVCLSTGGGEGVCLSACWDAIPPRMEGTPPGWRNPPDGEPPRMENPPGWRPPPDGEPPQWRTPPGSRLQHTVYERPVRILLECILVRSFNQMVNCQEPSTHDNTLTGTQKIFLLMHKKLNHHFITMMLIKILFSPMLSMANDTHKGRRV